MSKIVSIPLFYSVSAVDRVKILNLLRLHHLAVMEGACSRAWGASMKDVHTAMVLNGGAFVIERGRLESSRAIQYASCNASFLGNFCI